MQPRKKLIACFLAGTKILVENGYKDIDKIEPGDYVLTYNEDKKINEYKRVLRALVFPDAEEELYTMKTNDSEIVLTGYHRIYTYRNNEYSYVAAHDINVGDIVRYSDGTYHAILSITHKPINETLYNLTTEDNANFYVGNEGILVHNDNRTYAYSIK